MGGRIRKVDGGEVSDRQITKRKAQGLMGLYKKNANEYV